MQDCTALDLDQQGLEIRVERICLKIDIFDFT